MATQPVVARYVTVSKVLLVVAAIVFILAAFGVSLGTVGLVPLGLALFALAFVFP